MFGSSSVAATSFRAILLGSVALGLASPVAAQETTDVKAQVETLMREFQEMKAWQQQQQGRIEGQRQQIEAQKLQIEAQRQQLEAQNQQIEAQAEQLEARIEPAAAPPAPENVVTGGDYPGSFKVPGTNTSVKIGGYVKGDLIYDVNADTGDSFAASAIPAEDSAADEPDGSFRAHAKQSRVNLTTWTPTDTPIGEIKTFVEGDFLGAGGNQVFSNSTTFRIRHAYADFGPDEWKIKAGQNWTLFMPLHSYPETIDFFGPAGIPFVRQGQLRGTYLGFKNWEIAASVENSEQTGRDASGQGLGSEGGDLQFGIDVLPDFVGAVKYNGDRFTVKASAVARLLALDDDDTTALARGDLDSTEIGFGLHASASIRTIGDDSLQLNLTGGDGVGRYIINGFGQDSFLDVNGHLDALTTWGFAGGYTHHWTDAFRSNFVYGHYDVDDTFAATDTQTLDTAHVNLIWSPVPSANIGIEYIFGHRGFSDSNLDNQASRVQFGAQYLF